MDRANLTSCLRKQSSLLQMRETEVALSDLLKLADDKLAELFHKKQHDPEKSRRPILKGIDRTRNQFESPTPTKGKKWWKISNNVVEFTPPFPIGGKTSHYVPSERFSDYLTQLHGAVSAGELDDSLRQSATARAPRKTGAGGKAWTPERRARFAASVATRNAKKAAK